MGGQHEDTLSGAPQDQVQDTPQQSPSDDSNVLLPNQPKQQDDIPKVGELSQAIRFHVSGGEVHFHVDDEGLKVALPVAEWWSAWEGLKNLRTTCYRYVDHAHGTMLEVESGIDSDGNFEVVPTIKQISNQVGGIYQKLDDFTLNVHNN